MVSKALSFLIMDDAKGARHGIRAGRLNVKRLVNVLRVWEPRRMLAFR
jgi:hypothetical protein